MSMYVPSKLQKTQINMPNGLVFELMNSVTAKGKVSPTEFCVEGFDYPLFLIDSNRIDEFTKALNELYQEFAIRN